MRFLMSFAAHVSRPRHSSTTDLRGVDLIQEGNLLAFKMPEC